MDTKIPLSTEAQIEIHSVIDKGAEIDFDTFSEEALLVIGAFTSMNPRATKEFYILEPTHEDGELLWLFSTNEDATIDDLREFA